MLYEAPYDVKDCMVFSVLFQWKHSIRVESACVSVLQVSWSSDAGTCRIIKIHVLTVRSCSSQKKETSSIDEELQKVSSRHFALEPPQCRGCVQGLTKSLSESGKTVLQSLAS